MRLMDVARVVRSKNAGPLKVTVDVMFPDEASYQRASGSPSLTPAAIAERYGVAAGQVTVIPFPSALAVKVVMDRPVIAGTPGDTDVYGAQQHAPLLELPL